MNTLIRIMTFVVAAALTLGASAANQPTTGKQRQSREQLAVAQARHIAHEIALDDKAEEKFVDAYCQCQKEIWALGARRQKGEASNVNPKQQIQQNFERSQKILDIRQKYYKRYSTFLTQAQIQRVYELEKSMRQRLMKKRASAKNQSRRNR